MNEISFTIEHKYRVYPDSVINTDNSVIYKAQDIQLQRDVCIKEIRVMGDTKKDLERNLNKALSEARSMIKIAEKTNAIPNVYLHYYDSKTQKLYIVMDWINGKTLDKLIEPEPGRVDEFEFLGWMEELCSILLTMSGLKMYHKDIKPENIIIDKKKKLHLMDFNISVSLPNKIEGTPIYRAPEMETSKTVTRDKVDVFSIGVILYQFYTGRIPKKGSEYAQKSIRRYNADWDLFVQPKEINEKIPDKINSLIVYCMQKDPNKRYDIGKVLHEIKAYRREMRMHGEKNRRRIKK